MKQILLASVVVLLLVSGMVYSSEKEAPSVPSKAFWLRYEGKSRAAKEVLAGYLTEHPKDADAHFEYSRVLFYLFDLVSAEKHANLAIVKNPKNARYHCWRGMCAMYLYIDQAHHKSNLDPSILKRAIDGYQKAIELKPDYHWARFLLVNMLNNNPPEQGGDKNQAREHTQYLMDMDLDYGLQAAMIVEGEKPLDWKIEQYRQALTKEPENAGLHAGIARLYVESDQMKNAQEHIDMALELDKQQQDVLLDAVFPLAMKKNYSLAKEMVCRYLELSENRPAAMRAFAVFYLAKLEKMSGSPDADAKLEECRQIDPDVWTTMKAPPAMLFEPLEAIQ